MNNKNEDLISIVVPAYNAETTILETIDSLLNQTHSNFEIIIIDDGSTDGTKKVVESVVDKRIKYIYQENKGISSALNLGLENASSNYIARIDSDDIAYENRLEVQYKYLKANKDVVLVASSVDYIDSNGRIIGKTFPIIFERLAEKIFSRRNIYAHPSVMFRKKSVLECGGYNNELSGLMEDYFLWAKLRKVGKCKNLFVSLTKYRISSSQITSFSVSKNYRSIEMKIINSRKYELSDINSMLEEKKLNRNNKSNFASKRTVGISRNVFYRLYLMMLKVGLNDYYASLLTTVVKNIQSFVWILRK